MSRMTIKNANGEGSIRQRPDGTWEARVTVGFHPKTGKQIRRSYYGKTKREVIQKMSQANVDVINQAYISPSKITAGSWLELWVKAYLSNVKPSTVATYEQRVKAYLIPALGKYRLSTLKQPQIQALYHELSKTLAPKTVKAIHGVLHKALQQAVASGYIKSNPADNSPLPRITKPEIKPLDSAEINAFLVAIKGHKYENLYKVAIFTGMRLGELLGLLWDSVDLKPGTIIVQRQLLRPRRKGEAFQLGPLKNDKPRTIVPAPFVIDTLQAQRKTQIEQRLRAGSLWSDSPAYVFTDELGDHTSYWKLNTHLKNIFARLGIKDRRFHDLRHTYAVSSLRAGDDIKTVQENLGHHTAAFTLDTYGHVTTEMRQDSASRMQAFIDSIKQA